MCYLQELHTSRLALFSAGQPPFETESQAGPRSPQGGLSREETVPNTTFRHPNGDTLSIRTLDSDTVSHATVTQEVSHVAKAEEGGQDGTDAGIQATGGRGEDVSGDSPAADGVGEATPSGQDVGAAEPTVAQRFMSGQLVSTRGGIKTAAEAAEMAKNPPPFTGTTHGKVNARQGVHLAPPVKADYHCGDCRDLEARVTNAFKDLGYEF